MVQIESDFFVVIVIIVDLGRMCNRRGLRKNQADEQEAIDHVSYLEWNDSQEMARRSSGLRHVVRWNDGLHVVVVVKVSWDA